MSTRSDRASARAIDDLDGRLQALEELVTVGEGRLPTDTHSRAAATSRNARARLGHGGAHTVVALAGSTGSGKSSLFNAIAAADLSSVGVRRPTTSAASAAVFGSEADALLDWLAVPRRHRLDGMRAATTSGGAELDLSGLVLLDLPDHDSTVAAHRAEVDRLVQVVDVFVWVVDPQKYADAALHDDYLTHFAGHSDVSIVVLNHADVLDDSDRQRALDDLRRLLVADGMGDVRVMATSASTGEGVDQLVTELAAQASARRAFVSRLAADVDWVASDVAATIGAAPAAEVSRDARRRLELAFADAAGVDPVAEAVGKAHRVRGSAATGWPPTRWAVRLRPDPLRRLGLDRRPGSSRRRAGSSSESASDGAVVARTSRAAPDAVAVAKVDNALRALVDDTSAGLPTAWRDGVAAAVMPSRHAVARRRERCARPSHRGNGPGNGAPTVVDGRRLAAVAARSGDGGGPRLAGGDGRRGLVRAPRPACPPRRCATTAHGAGAGWRTGGTAVRCRITIDQRRRRPASCGGDQATAHARRRRGRRRTGRQARRHRARVAATARRPLPPPRLIPAPCWR